MKYSGLLNYEDDDHLFVKSLIFEGDQVRFSLLSHEWDEVQQGYRYALAGITASKTRDGSYQTNAIDCLDCVTGERQQVRIEMIISQGGPDELDVTGRWVEKTERPAFSGRLQVS